MVVVVLTEVPMLVVPVRVTFIPGRVISLELNTPVAALSMNANPLITPGVPEGTDRSSRISKSNRRLSGRLDL